MDVLVDNTLNEESSDALFAYMKHDSQSCFEKRILAGKILHKRQDFDQQRMANEKKLYVDALKKRLDDYNSPIKSALLVRRITFQPLLWSIFFTVLFVVTESIDYINNADKRFDWIGLSIFLLVQMVILIYQFTPLNKRLQKNVQAMQDEKYLVMHQLNRIEQEWNF